MKQPTLSLRNAAKLISAAAFGAAFLLAAPMPASAATKTVTGDFQSTDGNSGTFVRTFDTDGATTTVKSVLTRTSDSATSTDTTVTTRNADRSRTIARTHTDFGSTAMSSSNRTLVRVKGGFTATGTYTTAAGVTGTLTTIETNAGPVNIVATEFTSSTNNVTRDLRAEESEAGFTIVKTFSLDANGTSEATVVKLFVTSTNG